MKRAGESGVTSLGDCEGRENGGQFVLGLGFLGQGLSPELKASIACTACPTNCERLFKEKLLTRHQGWIASETRSQHTF